MSPLRKFITNISWNILGKGCVQVILFAVSILVTRYLGKERLGVYATLLVIPIFVRLLNQMGLETLVNKKLPELNVEDPTGRQGRFLVRRLLWFRFLSALVFCVPLYFLLPYYLEFIRMPELLEYRTALIFYFLVITVNSLFSILYMTLLKYKVVSIAEVVSAVTNLLLLGIFIIQDRGIYAVLYAYALSAGVNILIYLFLSVKDVAGAAEPPPWGEMRHLAWTSYAIALFSFGLMTQSDVLLMNYFQVDTVRIGYYHLATGLGGMLAFVLTGMGPLGLSILSETYARESAPGLSRNWCEIVGFAAFITVPIFVFAIFNAEALIVFVYGDSFAAAAAVLTLYVVFLCISTVLGSDFTVSTLFILHRRDTALRSAIEGSVLNVVLNLILIPVYRETGAVAATGSAMVYMVVRQLLTIRREIDIRPVFPTLGKCFLFALAAAVPTELAGRIFWDHVLLNAAVYVISFVFLLIGLKPFTQDHRRLIADIYPGLDPWVRHISATPGRS